MKITAYCHILLIQPRDHGGYKKSERASAKRPLEASAMTKTTTLSNTRWYPLCWYILGVLTYTTAWERCWGGDETLM